MAFAFYEFFAGGGMARLGLGARWTCLFANDIDPKKAAAYRANFGGDELVEGDIADVAAAALPGEADLAWASFPCQDLSLAGLGAGLHGARSGMFWQFWRVMTELREAGRAPRCIVLENVAGLLTSHRGRDFAAIAEALAGGGYDVGAMVLDAADFVPQSRPRLFFVAARSAAPWLAQAAPDPRLHPRALRDAVAALEPQARARWRWWRLPEAPARNAGFADVIDDAPEGVRWHTLEETRRLLAMMSPANLAKVQMAQLRRRRTVGAIYKRTRHDGTGAKVQRAEVRFDDLAGCLRTPGGGSSRQTILVVSGDKVRSRLLSAREAARLMGLPEEYRLPGRYNDAYHLAGDGVAVPVVRHLAEHLLEPMLAPARRSRRAA